MTLKRKVPESKLRAVQELSDLIKKRKTVLVASIKNIPASQFQEIVKKLREKAVVKVPKKNLIIRALDSAENENIKKLKEKIGNSVAILFSDLDSFELAVDLLENTSPTKAKAGQEAPDEIRIEAGPTDLMPGPAISQLGNLGIQIQIEKGKIYIKAPRVIVKKGEKISADAADVMNKLDIKPFKVGFIPLAAFDKREGKLYLEIKIDKEKTLEELKTGYSKSLAFAIEIGYINEDTIKFMIVKAGAYEKVLSNLIKEYPKEEKVEEGGKDTANAEDKDKPEDNTKTQSDSEDKEVEEKVNNNAKTPTGSKDDILANKIDNESKGETNNQNKQNQEEK